MAYGDDETTEAGPEQRSMTHGEKVEARLGLAQVSGSRAVVRELRDAPRPFNPYDETVDWIGDETQVNDWAGLSASEFDDAASSLSLQAVRVGISKAENVAREHRNRAEQADELAARLREAAGSAANHGRDIPMRDSSR